MDAIPKDVSSFQRLQRQRSRNTETFRGTRDSIRRNQITDILIELTEHRTKLVINDFFQRWFPYFNFIPRFARENFTAAATLMQIKNIILGPGRMKKREKTHLP